jgi:Cys-tRNA(Pro)/Cys-tRNA(Cys) deacylase
MTETRGTRALRAAGVPFELHVYEHAVKGALAASEALGIEPARLAKSLVAEVDGVPVFALLPGDGELAPKKLARAFGGRSARMAEPSDAERLTGYQTGGISPFGSRRPLPVFADARWLGHATVCLNGGRRGVIVELATDDLVRVLAATAADLAA